MVLRRLIGRGVRSGSLVRMDPDRAMRRRHGDLGALGRLFLLARYGLLYIESSNFTPNLFTYMPDKSAEMDPSSHAVP